MKQKDQFSDNNELELKNTRQLEVFYRAAAVMEYDPTLREKGNYEEFLRKSSRCVEVVCMQSHSWKMAHVKKQSQFLFRLKFLRDIMLHPAVDEPCVAALSSVIIFTTGEICTQVGS